MCNGSVIAANTPSHDGIMLMRREKTRQHTTHTHARAAHAHTHFDSYVVTSKFTHQCILVLLLIIVVVVVVVIVAYPDPT